MMALPLIVCLEGGIAAGKTTVFNVLKQLHPDWVFLPEPVESWTNWSDGQNWLQNFYDDPRKNALSFQKVVLESYTGLKRPFDNGKVCVSERSPRVATYVFTPLCVELGYVTAEDCSQLQVQYEKDFALLRLLNPRTVYLKTPANLSFQQLRKRGRPEEELVTPAYVQRLNYFHDKEFCDPENDYIID